MAAKSYVTVTDQFCGAGGSSLGATAAGFELRLALNHWSLAIETHNSNFPNAAHDCTDVHACDPRRYPSTDILITSPECTNHSLAKGQQRKWQRQLDMFGKLDIDPAEERSRSTMWDVCRFAEAHRYKIVIVENVVEARHWEPFDAWLMAMESLGYKHRCVYMNSQFAHPTPQSRDRMYVVFWQKSLRTPNLDFHPTAYCAKCGTDVASVQSWKNPRKPWGKYRTQYVYCCPMCAQVVEPYYYCAANAIDWSLPAPRIGDRARPLKEKTLKRIEVGLKKFGNQPMCFDAIHTARGDGHHHMVWPTTVPQRTQIGQPTHGLVVPPFLVHMQANNAPTDLTHPTPTMLTGDHQYLTVPPFIVQTAHPAAEGESKQWRATDAQPTQTARQELGVCVPPFLVSVNHSDIDRNRSVNEPLPAAMPQGNPAVVMPPPFVVEFRNNQDAAPLDDALSTVCTSGSHHGLCVPFIASYNSTANGKGVDAPLDTQDTRDRHALVTAPFIMSYYTRMSGQQAAVSGLDASLPTVPGRATHYLAQPGETPAVEDCGFRMLQPHEIQAAMAFPADYIVRGTQREKVKQLGNAVTPPNMDWLCARCAEVLG